MRAMMTRALKMTALRMALRGETRCMTFRGAMAGNTPTSIAGMIAKYFATSLAMLKVVSAPRVMSSCFPISTMSSSFVGLESRSTMLPASLAAWVPVFMATPTSAWASAGASLVPSPVMATRWPAACSSRMRPSFISGVAWARKSSTPASAAIAAAVSGLSPVIITVRMPMARSCANRSLIPPLTTSLRKMTPSVSRPSATTSGVPPRREISSTAVVVDSGQAPPWDSTQALTLAAAPLRIERAGEPSAAARSTPLMRVCAVNGTKCARCAERSRPRRVNFFLREPDYAAAPGRLIREGGERGGVGEPLGGDAGRRQELGGHPVAEGDRAGLVEEEHVDVARGLDGAPAHCEDVAREQAVHAGDADRAQEPADRGRDQADEQGDQGRDRERDARVHAEGLERDDDQEEDEGEGREQDRERDLVRRLLARGALDEADHVVQEPLAGIRGYADQQVVG